ncbi:hypothetical protein [Piscinibacter sp. XHJ-5]|uniref:hypothetical protein n=1 Tax=Piscinibacter sp. XHJ-5 TaxID=3037797 RepID=UPI002452E526|nr:hypothetical protein [Piscinibacter sp. XHJ-5]
MKLTITTACLAALSALGLAFFTPDVTILLPQVDRDAVMASLKALAPLLAPRLHAFFLA